MALVNHVRGRCSLILSFVCAALLLASSAVAESVQYCRFGHDDGQIDFCAGVEMHHNKTGGIDAYDLYLSFTVTRSSELGWTAIGTGGMMDGSLMFIAYGDPTSGESPILSIRTVEGHHQPRLLTQKDNLGGADLRVLQADWMHGTVHSKVASPSIYTARFAVVCYSCTRFPGSALEATSNSQPWIWAWNARQELPVYAFDAHLDMHAHHAGNGGWGVFYVDMARSVSEDVRRPPLPLLRPQVQRLGTSDDPIGTAGAWAALKANPVVAAHGLAMVAAFLVFFPAGTAVMRSGSSKSFKWHWIIQLVGCLFALAGVVIGIVMSGSHVLSTTHQRIGLAVAVLLFIQGIFGWRHHVVFVRIHRRTWISHAHIWLGRVGALGLGWANVLTGLMLSGHGRLSIGLTAGVIAVEVICLTIWIWRAKRRQSKQQQAEATMTPAWKTTTAGNYFAVEASDDGETDDENDIGKYEMGERK